MKRRLVLDKPFEKVTLISLGPTRPVKNRNGETKYRVKSLRIGVRFGESVEDLYQLLMQAKTLPELLRESLVARLKTDKKDLKWLSRTQNQSAYALEALLASLPEHIENLRTQANLLEDWMKKFDSKELTPKVLKSRMQDGFVILDPNGLKLKFLNQTRRNYEPMDSKFPHA